MHEYLILNEESLPFKTHTTADNNLFHFFQVVKAAFKESVFPIRVSEKFDSHWYHISLSDSYFLREWLKKQDKEYSRSIKTLISNTAIPHIPMNELECLGQFELSEFSLASDNAFKTPSLGASVILDAISISFLTSDLWDLSEVNLLRGKIDPKGEIKTKECVAKNAARVEHWEHHFREILLQRKGSYRKGGLLWDNRHAEFPNLIFCSDCKKIFTNLSISRANYDRLWENLKLLNNNIFGCNSDGQLKEVTQLNFTDESNRVKENSKLKRYREFTLPDKSERAFFGLHVKNFPGSFRLHFLPDYEQHKIYIGYFGKHLPL